MMASRLCANTERKGRGYIDLCMSLSSHVPGKHFVSAIGILDHGVGVPPPGLGGMNDPSAPFGIRRVAKMTLSGFFCGSQQPLVRSTCRRDAAGLNIACQITHGLPEIPLLAMPTFGS